MAYSDFTIDRLSTTFGVDFQGAKLFSQAVPVEPTAWLTETIGVATEIGYGSEKSRSERLVSPVLLELARRNKYQFAIISGGNLDVDPALGLNGECDFVFTLTHLQDLYQGTGILHYRSQKAGYRPRYYSVCGAAHRRGSLE